jgi:hypothetical protein
MTVLVGAFLLLTSEARKRNFIQDLATKPMARLANMTGYGTWQMGCYANGSKKKETLGKCHPNSIHRSLSSDPQ